MPAVTVIIPTYNSARFLLGAIRSVQRQSISDWELIIVDDRSTDGSGDLIAHEVRDSRIRVIRQSNQGDAAARNTGIRASKSPCVAFLDADDLWKPDKLKRQLLVMSDRPDVAVVYCGIEVETLSSEGQATSRRVVEPPEILENSLYEELLIHNVITGSHSSVMIRRDVIDQEGLFDERFRISDIDLWIRLSLRHSFFGILEPLVVIRKHGENSSGNKLMMSDNHLRLYAKLRSDVPPVHQGNLCAAAIYRFGMLTLGLLRRGHFYQAQRTSAVMLRNTVWCPLALGKLWRRYWTASSVLASHRCAEPIPGLLFPRIPCTDTP